MGLGIYSVDKKSGTREVSLEINQFWKKYLLFFEIIK